MTRKDREKREQCASSGCKYFAKRVCLVIRGNDCKYLGGNRIPRLKAFKSYEERITTIGAYFMVGGEV